jgi:CheY-like chemotaxis protein
MIMTIIIYPTTFLWYTGDIMSDDPKKIILIVDDTADFREIFSVKLTAAGYRTETAADGEEGIKKVRELHPDLVLLDVKMPGMNGEQVLAALRKDPATSSVKIVFTTSLGDPADADTDEALAKNFGADGYIRKTDDLDVLVAAAGEYLK